MFPSDESLFASHTVSAVWWAPAHARSVVVLGNASGSPITVTVAGSDGGRESTVIAAHGSRTLTQSEAAADRVTGGAGVHWARLDVEGPVASLRPGGFVEVDGRLAGAIRFYDPAAAKQPHLFGTNLPLAQTTPHLVLLNTSDAPVVATPRFLPLDADAASPVELASVPLAAGQATEVDLTRLTELSSQRPDLQRVSVQVLNSGPTGSLIGALSAYDEPSGLTEELPLRDTGPIGGSTGSYPWRLDADYSSMVSITNVTDRPLRFLARITYPGGVYWIPAQDLAPGASAAFNLRAIRDEPVKDRTGATLPATADHGQFRWSIIDAAPGAHLVGRVALVSRVNGITSSYSCQVCCPDGYGIGVISPGTLNVPIGGSSGAGVYEDLLDCYGNDAGLVARYATSWSIQYSSVTSVQSTGTGTMQANGLSDGTSGFDGHWDTSYYEADEFTHECFQFFTTADAPGTANVTCGDQRDTIKQEYVTYGVSLSPACADFTKTRHSVYFSYNEINTGDYVWALVKDALITQAGNGYGLDAWRANYGPSRIINSSYRNPARNAAVGGAQQSRHMYGDAGDLRNESGTTDEYWAMVSAANASSPDFVEDPTGACGYACVHADWRFHGGSYR